MEIARNFHCVKSVRIRSYSVRMREDTDTFYAVFVIKCNTSSLQSKIIK